VRLSQIFIYPLKSARGVALSEARLSDRGLAHDRRFMLVDAAGLFVTQRQFPFMARIETALDGERLRLSYPEHGSLEVALVPDAGAPRNVRVFRDEVAALDLGESPAAFFSDVFAQPMRLVYMPDAALRPVDGRYAREGDHVSFADGFPYLIGTEASLANLNARLEQPVPMNRFRPNLVIGDADAYAEDSWAQVRIGDAEFDVVKPCERCAIITTDQERGERSSTAPLKTLAGYHAHQRKAAFFQNAICRRGERVRVGDPVTAS
jgi:uncharacterized protein YcbX